MYNTPDDIQESKSYRLRTKTHKRIISIKNTDNIPTYDEMFMLFIEAYFYLRNHNSDFNNYVIEIGKLVKLEKDMERKKKELLSQMFYGNK
jgi:hypothetical protein